MESYAIEYVSKLKAKILKGRKMNCMKNDESVDRYNLFENSMSSYIPSQFRPTFATT